MESQFTQRQGCRDYSPLSESQANEDYPIRRKQNDDSTRKCHCVFLVQYASSGVCAGTRVLEVFGTLLGHYHQTHQQVVESGIKFYAHSMRCVCSSPTRDRRPLDEGRLRGSPSLPFGGVDVDSCSSYTDFEIF
jgi:hypothetical protein